jgi:hypothetical protein
MTVSAKVRKSLPSSRLGKPKSGGYPMPDRKHAAIAKAFAAMHHDPDKAAIDAKADRILSRAKGGRIGKQIGGPITGAAAPPNLGRAGRMAPRLPPQMPGGAPGGLMGDPWPGGDTPPVPHHPTVGPFFGGRAMYT